MNDRLRYLLCRPTWTGFFAERIPIIYVGCMAAGVMLAASLWPLASPAAAQVDIGDGERSLSVSGGCVQIRTGDRTLTVGACPKNHGDIGNPEAPQTEAPQTEAPQRSEDAVPEATGIEQSIPEATSQDQEKTSEAPGGIASEQENTESTVPEATISEAAEPGSHGEGMLEGGGSGFCPEPPKEGEAVRAVVARAIDGDTLELEKPLLVEGVESTDRVRLIGVDSPELSGEDGSPESYSETAAAFTSDMLGGEEVWLTTGEKPLDAYGRLLANVWTGNSPQNPPGAPSPDSEEPEPSASGEQSSGGEAEDEGVMSLFNLALVEAGLAEAMAVDQDDALAECFAAASRRADEAGLGIHSGYPEGEAPDSEESKAPKTMVSEQYAPEEDPINDPTPDESDATEPEAVVSEQYMSPEVTVVTNLETSVMDPDPEPSSTIPDEEPPAPEATVAGEPTAETLVAEESGSGEPDAAEPTAALDAPAPSAELVMEESPSISQTRPPSDGTTVSEGAATLSVSSPVEPTYPAERASDHLAALPDTGGPTPTRSSFGTLLIGLGLLASGVSLKLALRAGKTNPDAAPPPNGRSGGGSDE